MPGVEGVKVSYTIDALGVGALARTSGDEDGFSRSRCERRFFDLTVLIEEEGILCLTRIFRTPSVIPSVGNTFNVVPYRSLYRQHKNTPNGNPKNIRNQSQTLLSSSVEVLDPSDPPPDVGGDGDGAGAGAGLLPPLPPLSRPFPPKMMSPSSSLSSVSAPCKARKLRP